MSFHKLPSDPKVRSEWVEILKENNCLRDNFKITTKTRVCGEYFLSEDYKVTPSKKVLHIGAYPRVKFVNLEVNFLLKNEGLR